MRLSAFICNKFTTNVGPEESRKRRAQRPASKRARLNTASKVGLAADSALLGSGGTVTVLLGSTSIGTAALLWRGQAAAACADLNLLSQHHCAHRDGRRQSGAMHAGLGSCSAVKRPVARMPREVLSKGTI